MWARIKAIFRSLFGWAVRGTENPELLLKQYIDDMKAQIPQLNADVAEVVKYEKILGLKVERLRESIQELELRVTNAVQLGEDKKQLALHLIGQLEGLKTELTTTETSWTKAQANSEMMLNRRDAYEIKIRSQINQAMTQLSRHKQAQIEEKMANAMANFNVGSEVDTLERVTGIIDEKVASAEAKQEVASGTLEGQLQEVDAVVAKNAAEDTYLEYQQQLGLAETPEKTERTMGPVELATEIEIA